MSHNATQANGSKQPLWVDNVQNGKPIIRFDGADDYLTASNIINGTGARTVVAVVKSSDSINETNSAPFIELSDEPTTTNGIDYRVTTEIAVRVLGNKVFNTV